MRGIIHGLVLVGVGWLGYETYCQYNKTDTTFDDNDDDAAALMGHLGGWTPQLPIHPKSDPIKTEGAYSQFVRPGRKSGLVPARNVDYFNPAQLYASTGPVTLNKGERDQGEFSVFTQEAVLQ